MKINNCETQSKTVDLVIQYLYMHDSICFAKLTHIDIYNSIIDAICMRIKYNALHKACKTLMNATLQDSKMIF